MSSNVRGIAVSVFLAGIVLSEGGARAQSTDAASESFFEAKVRPILAKNCYSCHTDSELSGLRLDSAAAMLKGGKRGPAVVPGDPDKSLFIQAVRQSSPDLKMPMGGKLKDPEIADLTAWVKAGAAWPTAAAKAAPETQNNGLAKYVIPLERRNFWSFLSLNNPPVPQPKDAKWARNAIDRFVLDRLEKEGLKPVRPASKHDLLRRATIDLIGIPPTPAEYAAFEKDNSPDAFAKLVDRLLASPHYGERWGRVWLDVARYAEEDVKGVSGSYPYPNAYLYRDWVIQAMNDDMPYDKFVKAQIAGDLLDPKTRHETLPATGFVGLGPWYFDSAQAETARAQERNEQLDAVTRGFLGLTVACARCHNHKYDPIPQTDYYALAGVFLNTSYRDYPQAPQAVVERRLNAQVQVERMQNEIRNHQAEIAREVSESFVPQIANYLMGVWEATNAGKKKEIGEIVESRKLDYEVFQRWIGFMSRPTTWHDQKNAWQAMMKSGGDEREAERLAREFQASVERVTQAKVDVEAENKVIAAKAMKGTVPAKRASKPSDYKTNEQYCAGCDILYKQLPEKDAYFWLEIYQIEIPAEGYDPYINSLVQVHTIQGPLAFKGWALQHRLTIEQSAKLADMTKKLEDLRKQVGPAYTSLDGVEDNANITDLELNVNGSPFNLGPKVPRHFLSVLSEGDPQPFTKGSGRLELAEEIIKQPIAMRVIVNRVWKEHFGTGIVDTPSNFGTTGERPTNPELLEYLASQFVRDGMSVKKLHRNIMLSAAYQLSTEHNEANAAKDEGNRLYWRANQRRMTAEELRDSILAVAGSLDDSMGGPSAQLTPTYTRRTVYGTVSRFKLDPFLQIFDYPNPSSSAEKRFTTTIPLQRLFLMNSDFMQLRAEELAKAVQDQQDSRARIRKIYSLVYGREPSEEELTKGLDYVRSEPLRAYEERRAKLTSAKSEKLTSGSGPAPSAQAEDDEFSFDGEAPAGMMAGVGGPSNASALGYEPTVWGRYVKLLLGSSEFIHID